MKKVLLLAVLLLLAAPQMHAKGDEEEVKIVLVKEENSDNYYYEGVVPVEGVSKEEMFKRAKEWVLSNFKTGDNNAQFDEKEFSIYNNPTIVTEKYRSDIYGNYINFKIKLNFKDGKYRFRIDNVIVKLQDILKEPIRPYNDKRLLYGIATGKTNKDIIENINITFLKIATDLENTIKGNTAKKDDW